MNKIGFVVLFLFSSMVYGSGNVYVIIDGKLERSHLIAIKKCGKPIVIIYNRFGKTRVVLFDTATYEEKRQVTARFQKLPFKNKIRILPTITMPCDPEIET